MKADELTVSRGWTFKVLGDDTCTCYQQYQYNQYSVLDALPSGTRCCSFVQAGRCYHLLFPPDKIQNSSQEPSVAACLSPSFSTHGDMKQTKEQAILLFSGIFNCDEKGLCRFL